MKSLLSYHTVLASRMLHNAIVATCILAVVIGCASSAKPHAESTNTVVGAWETEPIRSQLGTVVNHYQFATNGTFKCWVDFLSATSLSHRVVSGNYHVVADKITMVTKRKTNEVTFAFRENLLVLDEGPGKKFFFKRQVSNDADTSERKGN